MLNYTLNGDAALPTLIIAHGLYGSARNWGVLSRRLSDQFHVIAVDMRNHGNSARMPTQDYPAMADDLAEVIKHTGGKAHVLGHSMGGKAAMVLAINYPQLVEKLIVADIAPVAYATAPSLEIAAMQSVNLVAGMSRKDADAALAADIDDPQLRAFLLQSLDVSDEIPRWRLNLPVLDAYFPEVRGFPDISGAFLGETLFLTGAQSDYVLPAHNAEIARLFPQHSKASITGAGHWLHAEKPREFEIAVREFLTANS